MKKTNETLAIITILLFAIGLWPITIVTLIALLVTSYSTPQKGENQQSPEQRVQELEEENRQLREQVDQKFIQDIIDKTSGK